MGGDNKTIQQLEILYKNIMNILKNCNVEIIIFYGSLLGYYRDSNFINNDDDIDVIISRKEYDIVKNYVEENKDKYPELSFGINNNDILQLYYNDIGPFDIYPFNDDNHDILINWDGHLLFEKKYIFPTKNIEFNDFNISIPNDTETILFQIYGTNWKIPQIKNIDYTWKYVNTVRKKYRKRK
jgi:phosphorylcholine metabolism protein LicD